MCALAGSKSTLRNVVKNDDIEVATRGLQALGYCIQRRQGKILVSPRKAPLGNPAKLDTGHSGTFSRFVTALAGLESQPVQIDCSAKMATRPMAELFTALAQLGVVVDSPNQCLPAKIQGPMTEARCTLDPSRSSQFLSALLIISPLLQEGLTINLQGPVVSAAYLQLTIELMAEMGVTVELDEKEIRVAPGQEYRGLVKDIPGDAVSASYFMAAAAIAGGRVEIKRFQADSIQGESGFYRVLQRMGVETQVSQDKILVEAKGWLQAIDVDMGEMPDAVQTLAAIACFAEGVTEIRNIGHLAYKESDRIQDTATELRKTGIRVEAGEDFLRIHGGKPKAELLETHDDHRMAMSLALLGIRTPGIVINNAQVVAKSFPSYWEKMAQIGIESRS